jgi:hypothetical protein
MRLSDEHDKLIFAVGMGLNWFLSGFDNPNLRPDNAPGPDPASGRNRTNQDTVAMTMDAHLRIYGISLDVAFFYRKTEFHNRGSNTYSPRNRAGIGDITDMGFTVDVAYFIIPKTFNVGVRFNLLDADDFWMNGSRSREFGVRPDTTELGLSVNYYLQGDNLKLKFDILMVSQQLPFGANADGVGGSQSIQGVYNSPPARGAFGGSGENSDYNDLWIVRLQLQWIF